MGSCELVVTCGGVVSTDSIHSTMCFFDVLLCFCGLGDYLPVLPAVLLLSLQA